jgi:hypothetical protein
MDIAGRRYARRVFETSNGAFGNVSLSLSYGVWPESTGRPSVIISADGRIPTDGFEAFALGCGLALVKSINPTAVFASVNHLHTFDADSRGPTELQHEETVSATAGFVFAMNDRLSFSTAISGVFNARSELAGGVLPADEDYSSGSRSPRCLRSDCISSPFVCPSACTVRGCSNVRT